MTDLPTNPLRDARDRRLPQIAGPCSVVLMGVTGDLSRRKLIPAIYDLANRGLLPPGFGLVGFARADLGTEGFAELARDAAQSGARTQWRETVWQQLYAGVRFVQGDLDDPTAWERLASTLRELDTTQGTGGNHAFYLAIPPALFPIVISSLQDHGLANTEDDAWRRVVIEKPFGHDLESARYLNTIVGEVFDRESVFRIDHYLGKETVQNILAFRFANGFFEPVWNSNYIDHVQITMAESIGIGSRAGYYDDIGAARDVVQNHLLQLMALIAMEEPVSFNANSLRIEKQKILANAFAADPLSQYTSNAQYEAGWAGGERVAGYRHEEGIDPDSSTETYAAMRIDVMSRRWAGVPFYLRTGKRLGRRVTEVAVVFKRAPHQPFARHDIQELGENAIVMRIQPDEGVTMRFGAKVPGTAMEIRDVNMDFAYGDTFVETSPEAYERLLLDVLLGEPPLFPQREEVELSWKILDPVIDYWRQRGTVDSYGAGTWGPTSADQMMGRDGRRWRRP